MVMDPSQLPARHKARRPGPPLRWNARNLLLLLPLMVLLTPLYNRIEPKLFGMPFFYWFQLAFLLVTVFLTVLFVALTKDDDQGVEVIEAARPPEPPIVGRLGGRQSPMSRP